MRQRPMTVWVFSQAPIYFATAAVSQADAIRSNAHSKALKKVLIYVKILFDLQAFKLKKGL
jgi:hypothetical protein